MEIAHFAGIRDEFMRRAQQAIYCSVATVDGRNRPRSRVLHLVWDGPTGWVITRPDSHKARHLAGNAYVSIAYLGDPHKPVYIDARAKWEEGISEKRRVWELHRTLPPPLGFDPTPHYGTIEHPYFGLLPFTPWRFELAELGKESRIWRPTATTFSTCLDT